MANNTDPSPLPPLNRYITTHTPDGLAVLDSSVPSTATWTSAGSAKFFLGYCTSTFPAAISNPSDIQNYSQYLSAPPGLVVPGGTVLRIVDVEPGHTSPMHRTTSLDYGVVLEGEVELILDSGETKVLKRGDTCVQRGTNHAWRNTSDSSWARMLYVLVEAQPIELEGGKKLGEDLGGMVGVRKSAE
ncbi:Cupin domain protein [Rutstroemia sp. NJR-2017a BVV2]|nr:Cupin domain protein [Rutstroemia sp. NJR-2017a BVV2]